MQRRSSGSEDWNTMRDRIVGLGERSVRKSYYPELRGKIKDLDHQRVFLQSVLDSIPEGVAVYNADGVIIQGNPALYTLFGHPLGSLEGQPVASLEGEPLSDGGDGGMPPETRLFRRKDGSTFYGKASVRELRGGDGVLIGRTMVVSDLSERAVWIEQRRELEEQLLQSQKMEALGTLAGGIAHDFNNLLSAILGYAELAQLRLDPGDPARQSISQVIVASQKASDLVNQILAFSRREQSRRGVIRLAPLVKESVKLLRGSIPSTISIRERIRAPEVSVHADPTQIHQVLMNLCTNAFHALEEQGGEITLQLDTEVCVRRGDSSGQGEYVCIAVQDTGCGIDPAILDRVFEPYFTTKGKGRGTGMGLAVVHGVVKSHGGIVRVSSQQGQGTTFEVLLPVAKEQARQQTDQPAAVESSRGRESILVVDDEEMIIEILSTSLERLGYTVTALNSSQRALDLIRREPGRFDLVITDQTMPDLTGLELAAAIHELQPLLPVIICSGYSAALTRSRLDEAGIWAYIGKPISISTMAASVRAALDGEPARL